jgi:hypothetical protein
VDELGQVVGTSEQVGAIELEWSMAAEEPSREGVLEHLAV